jgi:hypothetical protein
MPIGPKFFIVLNQWKRLAGLVEFLKWPAVKIRSVPVDAPPAGVGVMSAVDGQALHLAGPCWPWQRASTSSTTKPAACSGDGAREQHQGAMTKPRCKWA